jgi:CRISPR/Cas system-associated exonuclease Cas4 (RecB family)
MDHTNQAHSGDDLFSPEEMVNASELKDFLYCRRVWFLNRQGFRVSDKALREREAGIAFHEERADAARKSSNARALWWGVLLGLAGIVFLLLQALLESRR